MKLDVLVATMNQSDHSLVKKMNIKSNAIIVNQCDKNLIEMFKNNEQNITIFSLAEKGVGLNRNTALMRSKADICLFADDDVTYIDEYENIIYNAFKEKPNADVIIFNVESTNKDRPGHKTLKWQKLNRFNCMKYGTYRIAVKRLKVMKKNISFSLLFGGGAIYGSGEDSLFIYECIRKGLNVYACPYNIGYVNHEISTWFNGNYEKMLFDRGAFFACISERWSKLLCMQLLIRHPDMYKCINIDFVEAFNIMKKGIIDFRGE